MRNRIVRSSLVGWILAAAMLAVPGLSMAAISPTPISPPGDPQPGPNSGPPAAVTAPFAPDLNAVSVASASAPMTLQCLRTPAYDVAAAANPPTSVGATQALCRQFGRPLPATMAAAFRHRRPARMHKYSPSLCGNAGCAYIWLYNDGNGYGEAEYQADPYAPYIVKGGSLGFQRYTKNNQTWGYWSDTPEHNCGVGSFCGYRYIYPIANTGNSWVEVAGSGTVNLGTAVASWGPVETWNYITK